ncbi:DUF302 domain-containing protein [Pseudoruegeria sp. SHC-113]|uniref:DUF302 domain-containing protein n=1 Tax=Pseudoruegeria sp. SHC-113 TaxID=2855439 RepID=UPI0021BA4889|nr:DUF302 domain-containing protein [Pseudoruegeria sp. SHC-113]MCT8159630.1 DUF302 domain-containing protein [Pseudoruegeria sp. SHC-113]
MKPLHFRAFAKGAAFAGLFAAPALADTLQADVDAIAQGATRAIESAGLTPIVEIDHARLAEAEGVAMPPSRVQIFSDPAVNTPLLAENIRAGLDLPFRLLAYGNGSEAAAITTGAGFLQIRHGLSGGAALEEFSARLASVTGEMAGPVATAPTEALTQDYGVIELTTGMDVPTAVASLKEVVMAQDDTVWFGEIDFTAEAEALGTDVPDAVLLLFGGPGPGGVAMADFPAIGLDAFCQKLLVYAGADGTTKVIFNDIAAFAELHYGTSAKPHHALNERLTATFSGAIAE